MVLSAALILIQIPPVSANQQVESSSVTVLSGVTDKVTVTTTKQFMDALERREPNIVVSGLITIGQKADSDGSMLPVMIPEGTTIEGISGGTLNCRCPIQLEGDGVIFQNMGLQFESSDALNSVPHREIFLAGHELILDNVDTYLEGSGGSLGPLGGSEAELLPSVFAGGYKNTSVGSNAVLTIRNSNSKTIFQDIYMGHGAGRYQNVPYEGDVEVNLDNLVAVRGGVYTDQNRSAEILLSGGGKTVNYVNTKSFIGNNETTLTITGCSASRMFLDSIGNVKLENDAYLMPQTSRFRNISVQGNSCLDLSETVNATVTGNFEGGSINSSDSSTAAGTLVLDKEGTLTIQGTVTGTTFFQTESKNFPGIPVFGRNYIIAAWNELEEENFVIPEKYIVDGYKVQYNANAWTIFKSYENEDAQMPEIGEVEVSYAPTAVDLTKIKAEYLDDGGVDDSVIPDESIFCKIVWKDTKGNAINFYDIIDEDMGYFFHEWYTLFIKTEYLEDSSYNTATDWGNTIRFICSKDHPDYYYFTAQEGFKTGNYTIRFYSVDTQLGENATVEHVKQLDEFVKNEIQVYFYDSSADTGTISIQEQAAMQPISEQIYTGKPICPEVKVTDSSGTELTVKEDYIVSYENNVDVGEANVKVVGIGKYSGTIEGTFSIVKSESDVLLTAIMNSDGTGTNMVYAIYGDKIRFVCQAVPSQAEKARPAKAQPNTVDFYCGDVCLGTASVDANGQAVFVYHTAEQKIPIGTSTVYADFGGTTALNPAQSESKISITLEKQVLAAEDIKSITLKDFSYDGVKKTTEIVSLIWSKSQGTSEESKVFFLSGEAELAGTQAGAYRAAEILSWSLNEEDANWYELPKVTNSLLVDPEVTILPAKAPEQVTIFSSSASGEEQTVSIKEKIPTEWLNENLTYQLGKTQFNSSISSAPSIENGILTYQAGTIGTETIPVIVTSPNYQPMTVVVNVLVTDKNAVEITVDAPDITYNGTPYDAWKTEISKDLFTVSYYDVIEQQSLKEAPTDAGSYSITVYMENDTEIGEGTSYFQINPKEIRIRPIDKTIQIGEQIPDLSNPQLDIDYEFESGYEPVSGENLGTVKMLYEETPDNTKEGSYNIVVGFLEKDHKNYTITEKQGTLYISSKEEHIHHYEETITKEASCTEDGIKTYICSECKDSYTEKIPANGHTYGEWIIDKEPTSTEEGIKHRVCTICKEEETVTIPIIEDDSKPEETEPGEDDSKPEETEPGEDDSKPEETEPGEDDSKPEETEPGEDDSKPEETEPGEDDSKPEETEPGEDDSKPEETEPGEDDSKPEETKPGEDDSKPEETEPGEDDSKPEETAPGEDDSKPEETTPGNYDSDDDDSDDDDDDSEDDFYRPENSSKDPVSENSPIKTENMPSAANKADYRDSIRGYISFTQGIITGNESGYAKWKQSNDSWWLEYADGTWPHGRYTSSGQQIYKWERINGAWYAFNADGYAEHGWQMDAGYQGWFYIDINSGMKTGWQLIEGKWYYLNPVSDGTRGKMFSDCYTPDGWYVDKSGAWDGKPQRKK